jgi:anti-sigma B factor antagonist
MQVEDRKEGDVLVVKLLGARLDAKNADEFRSTISGYISGGNERIVLDMSQVDFVDSSGLGAMVSVLKSLGNENRLGICGTQESVMRMFKLTRVNKVFNIFDGETQAVRALSPHQA